MEEVEEEEEVVKGEGESKHNSLTQLAVFKSSSGCVGNATLLHHLN